LTLVFGAEGLEAARYVERLPDRTTTSDVLRNSAQPGVANGVRLK
jgi:hypothetical protein